MEKEYSKLQDLIDFYISVADKTDLVRTIDVIRMLREKQKEEDSKR